MLMETFGKCTWIIRVLFNRSGEAIHLLSIRETPDGKQHLVVVCALAGGIEILPDVVESESFFKYGAFEPLPFLLGFIGLKTCEETGQRSYHSEWDASGTLIFVHCLPFLNSKLLKTKQINFC